MTSEHFQPEPHIFAGSSFGIFDVPQFLFIGVWYKRTLEFYSAFSVGSDEQEERGFRMTAKKATYGFFITDFPFDLDVFFFHRFCSVITVAPNKSPEPTAVGAGRSAVAVHVTSRRWLSLFR